VRAGGVGQASRTDQAGRPDRQTGRGNAGRARQAGQAWQTGRGHADRQACTNAGIRHAGPGGQAGAK
jgi:hypothetical protein